MATNAIKNWYRLVFLMSSMYLCSWLFQYKGWCSWQVLCCLLSLPILFNCTCLIHSLYSPYIYYRLCDYFMCCLINCLTSKAAAVYKGIYSMREEPVNNNDTLIIINWLLIWLWWFCLVISIGWTCSIDGSMCSPSEHLYAAFTKVL